MTTACRCFQHSTTFILELHCLEESSYMGQIYPKVLYVVEPTCTLSQLLLNIWKHSEEKIQRERKKYFPILFSNLFEGNTPD